MIPVWIFTAISALILASTAGYFSIIGLGSLYAAAFMPVVVMGMAIEISKISATFWLHRNAKTSPIILSIAISILIFFAMAVTSGGVYGFLTKGHLDQETPINETGLQIERIDQRLLSKNDLIKREQIRLTQLDGVIQKLIDFDKISGPTGARAARLEQKDERNEIQNSIDLAYDEIDKLNDKKLPLKQSISQVEAKLGPVKYLAALFNTNTENTIVYFTLLIVLLLDPFAILLVIATSISYDTWRNRNREIKKPLEEPSEGAIKEPANETIEELVEETDNEVLESMSSDELTVFLEDPQVQDALLNDTELFQQVKHAVDLKHGEIGKHGYKYGATDSNK